MFHMCQCKSSQKLLLSTVTYMKTVCGLSLGATGEAPHRVNTLVSKKNKETEKPLFQSQNEPQGKRHTIRELWEACTNTIHTMDKEEAGKKKPHTINKTPKITEHFSLWKN